jgi:hypothetical protein
MNAAITEFFEIEDFDPADVDPDRVIVYRLGKDTGTTQYINIRSAADADYIRKICQLFLEHIRVNRTLNADQINLYNQVYTAGDPGLPKPDFKRTGLTENTWHSFISGIEDNFNSGTIHYTMKQWPHVINCVNIAIGYFNSLHPERLGADQPYVRVEQW